MAKLNAKSMKTSLEGLLDAGALPSSYDEKILPPAAPTVRTGARSGRKIDAATIPAIAALATGAGLPRIEGKTQRLAVMAQPSLISEVRATCRELGISFSEGVSVGLRLFLKTVKENTTTPAE